MDTDLLLVQDLCARLCHDLGGPVGTVAGALDLADSAGEEALDLAKDAAASMRARLRVWRAACGGGVGDMTAPALSEMLDGVLAGGRARLDTHGLSEDVTLPAATAQLLLTGCLLAGEALPRGGIVHMEMTPEGAFHILPEGRVAAWPPALAAALAGEARDGGPREVLGPFLISLAQHLRHDVALVRAADIDTPVLAITPSA
ncbi:hypothetical protein IAI18_21055 [Acetobacteraceae bacterium H6797]|nr:hypothetical protein [Acetobacteraceae bacterium H6797]